MTLTINGERVDFRLEKERFLREALQGVESWLSDSGLVITAIRCNGKELPDGGLAADGGIPLETVDELALEIRHARELRIAALREEIERLGERARAAPAGEREEASRLLGEASDRYQRTMKTYAALQALSGELSQMEAKIGDVSVLLQSGKDREAMETVTRFTDLIESVLSILPATSGSKDASALFAEINPRLRDVVDAFTAGDFILVGDILEYEIAPRLSGLSALLARCA